MSGKQPSGHLPVQGADFSRSQPDNYPAPLDPHSHPSNSVSQTPSAVGIPIQQDRDDLDQPDSFFLRYYALEHTRAHGRVGDCVYCTFARLRYPGVA